MQPKTILEALAHKNPYKDKERAYMWATGFLAALLADVSRTDTLIEKKIAGRLDLLNRAKSKG